MADRYAAQAAFVAVAQVAEAAGFDASQSSVLNILAELLLRFINEVGGASHGYAELAGRTEPNALDILLALNDMGVSTADLSEYIRAQDEIPPAQNLTTFPVPKRQKQLPTFMSLKEIPPSHIPSFLPAFPDEHTYKNSEAFVGYEQNSQQRRLKDTIVRQDAVQAALKLEARLYPDNNVLEKRAAQTVEGNDIKLDSINPYLTPTLWENQISQTSVSHGGLLRKASNVADSLAGQAVLASMTDQAQPAGMLYVEELKDSTAAINSAVEAQWQPLGSSQGSPRAPPGHLFLSWDWKANLHKKACLGNSGGGHLDAFVPALDTSATGTKHGRRAKKTERARAAQIEIGDPTKRRVDEILSARLDETDAAAVEEEFYVQEQEHI